MEKTPLELYETAYKLHYNEKKIASAVKVYEALVSEFPDSDECGYAVIQLQKIKSGSIAEQIQKQKNSTFLFAVSSFIFACIAILACGLLMFFQKSQFKTEQAKNTLTISALVKIINGEDSSALIILDRLKKLDRKNIVPVNVSADMYMKKVQYQKALNEYETFLNANPGYVLSDNEQQVVAICKSKIFPSVSRANTVVNEKTQNSPAPASANRTVAQPDIQKISTVNIVKENAPKETVKPVKSKQPVSEDPAQSGDASQKSVQKNKAASEAQSKDLFVVDPDSLSYF